MQAFINIHNLTTFKLNECFIDELWMIVGKNNNGHKQYIGFANDHKVKHHYKQLKYGYIFNQHKPTFTTMPTYINFVGKNL